MPRRRRRPQLILLVLLVVTLANVEVVHTALQLSHLAPSAWAALFLGRIFPALALLMALGPFIHVPAIFANVRLPGWVMSWVLGPSYLFVMACVAYAFFGGLAEVFRLLLGLPPPGLGLRELGLALPFLLAAHGASMGQLWTRVERLPMVLRGLGAGLEGTRIVQLSDLHAGGMVGPRRLSRIARKVRRLRPDLVVITGDIVNASPRDAELCAPILASIEAPLGVWACMGNHDHFVDGDRVAEILERAGVKVLRNRGELVSRGGAALWLAGVDDSWTRLDDVDAALAGKPEGIPTLLLAHDPNLWPKAVARKVEWTLSGHTHGGQIGLVKLHPSISLARLITPFVAGHYERDGAALYVSRGTANTLPLRLGAPTEVSVFELKAS